MSQGAFEEFKKLLEKYFYLPQVDSLSLLPVDSVLKDMVWFDDTKLRKIFDYYRSREDKKASLDALVKTLVFRDLDTEVALLAEEGVHQVFGKYLQKSFDLAMEELRVFSEHSEQQIEKQVTKTKVAVFPSAPDLRWEEVSMTLVSDEVIKVRARKQLSEYRFDQIGFKNEKNGKPNILWWFLRALAQKGGELSWDNAGRYGTQLNQNQVQSNVKRLRKSLREFMAIKDDPFYPYKKVKAYQTRFTLTNDAPALVDSADDVSESGWETVFDQEVNRLP